MATDDFNPYHQWLGLDRGVTQPTYYELLGIDEKETQPERIAAAAEQALSRVRGFRPGPRAALWARLLDEIATAKRCLFDPSQRAAYDLRLREGRFSTMPVAHRPAPRSRTALPDLPPAEPSQPGPLPMSAPPAATPAPAAAPTPAPAPVPPLAAPAPAYPPYPAPLMPASPYPPAYPAPQPQPYGAPVLPPQVYAPTPYALPGIDPRTGLPIAPGLPMAGVPTYPPAALPPAPVPPQPVAYGQIPPPPAVGSLPMGMAVRGGSARPAPTPATTSPRPGRSGQRVATAVTLKRGPHAKLIPMLAVTGGVVLLLLAGLLMVVLGTRRGARPGEEPVAASRTPPKTKHQSGEKPSTAPPTRVAPKPRSPAERPRPRPADTANDAEPLPPVRWDAGADESERRPPDALDAPGTLGTKEPASSPVEPGTPAGNPPRPATGTAPPNPFEAGPENPFEMVGVGDPAGGPRSDPRPGPAMPPGPAGSDTPATPGPPAPTTPPKLAADPAVTPAEVPVAKPKVGDGPSPEPGPRAKSAPDAEQKPPQPAPAKPPAAQPKREEVAALARGLTAARDALARYDFDRATAELKKVETLPKLPEHQAKFDRLNLLSEYAKNFRQALLRSLQGLHAGDQITLGTSGAVGIVEATPQRLSVRVAGQNRTYPINDIPTGLAVAVADSWLDKKDPVSLVLKAAYVASRNDATPEQLDRARQWFQEAQQKGVDLLELAKVTEDRYDLDKDLK